MRVYNKNQLELLNKFNMLDKCALFALLQICTVFAQDPPNAANFSTEGEAVYARHPNLLRPPNCGQKDNFVPAVSGGERAQASDWPWIAALGYHNDTIPRKPDFLCGGTLISANHVLTASHCVTDKVPYMVRIGTTKLTRSMLSKYIDVNVALIIAHPEYDSSTMKNDIAVLKLDDDVDIIDPFRTYPICLPVNEPLVNDDFTGKNATVAGWGWTGWEEPPAINLMEVDMPVVGVDACKNAYKSMKDINIYNSSICAGHEDKGACVGDSGGPLTLNHGEYTYQIGVVSYGYKCALPGYPTIYSRVTKYLDFINSALDA